ncbi:MAG: RNA polymerase sigma factor [Calditrichaeota bacterium]|nr:RNA polymerase sigma factor [Calditrichota bacterium]
MYESITKEVSDREAVEACLRGETEMYRHIVERYKERAYYMALMFTKNHEDALDLSQEAFYRAYRSLGDFDSSRSFYSWFYRILKNLCINFVNKHKRTVRMDETMQQIFRDWDDYPDEVFEKNERSEIIWKALSQLNEKDREIIVMKDFNEFSYQEIADALEIPLGSVMSRLYYARKRLLKKLQHFEGAL